LKYRAGKKGKKPEVDTTFDPDDGMRMESEYDQQREITAASKQELSGRHM
jgi:hypothetical protein